LIKQQGEQMSQAQTVEDRIRDFVLRQFPLARKSGVKPEDKWLETGLVDSLGILDLVHFLEEEFSIHVSDDELSPENFQSLAAVVSFVDAKQSASIS
jgi:acyl carrier protein